MSNLILIGPGWEISWADHQDGSSWTLDQPQSGEVELPDQEVLQHAHDIRLQVIDKVHGNALLFVDSHRQADGDRTLSVVWSHRMGANQLGQILQGFVALVRAWDGPHAWINVAYQKPGFDWKDCERASPAVAIDSIPLQSNLLRLTAESKTCDLYVESKRDDGASPVAIVSWDNTGHVDTEILVKLIMDSHPSFRKLLSAANLKHILLVSLDIFNK